MSGRNIAVITGTRAEYGLLNSSMNEIRLRDDLELTTIATGMHLSPQHGRTVEDIRDEGFTIDSEVLMLFEGDSGTAMAKSLGAGVSGLADALENLSPDIVLVLGDRDEALAGALAAAHMNIPVAHVHGGDAMQGAIIDDSIRHAITKFAHIHFPVSEASAERIRKLGEEVWRITIVGAPGLDDIRRKNYADPDDVGGKYGFDPSNSLALVVQHPLTTQPSQAGQQMAVTLDALGDFPGQVVIIYPNTDAGGKRMIEVIESRNLGGGTHVFENLPRQEFLALMELADVMIGNSSSGIIEAPSFDLPVVDIGPRQQGRERASNILSVPHETDAIKSAIERCLSDQTVQERAASSENPYDYGGASDRIVERLASIDVDKSLMRKKITY